MRKFECALGVHKIGKYAIRDITTKVCHLIEKCVHCTKCITEAPFGFHDTLDQLLECIRDQHTYKKWLKGTSLAHTGYVVCQPVREVLGDENDFEIKRLDE